MNIQQELKLRTANLSFKDIALFLMEYNLSKAIQASNRIQSVVTSRNVGLDSGNYDFKYSDAEFVLKLCEVLGLDVEESRHQVEEISTRLFEWKNLFKPSVYVDTNFHRTTEPIHALAFMEGHRRIPLPELARLPLHEQIEKVKLIIVQHYQHCSGKLPMWGIIQRYKFFYAEKQSITFDIEGNVVETGDGSAQPAAKITINGKDLTKIILE